MRAEALGDLAAIPARLAAGAAAPAPRPAASLPRRARAALERIADVPIYAVDPIVRRAPALQMTADAAAAGRPACRASSPPSAASSTAPWCASRRAAARWSCRRASIRRSRRTSIRVAAAHPLTAALGPMFGRLEIALEPVAKDAGAVAAGVV